MSESIRLLGLAGSLRDSSFNRALITAAAELAPHGVAVAEHSLVDVPMYDGSLDPKPAAVQDLISAIDRADGVLLATPEFNYGIPGVLKNAIDWASRPAYQSVFAKKPVAVMSVAL